MDQNALVNEEIEGGKQLMEALTAAGFEVRVAFWAKPTETGKWYLYLASPFVDDKGRLAAYQFVHALMRNMPNLWIEPLEVKVIGLNDSLAEAALAARKPRPYPGMTRFGASTLGGLSIDGAYIYPAPQSTVSA